MTWVNGRSSSSARQAGVRIRLARPFAIALFGALLLVGATAAVLVVGSLPQSMNEVFLRDLAWKMRTLPGERFACDRAARPDAGGAYRCVDYRAYRVLLGEKTEVFSMRGSEPQMLFGIEGLVEYENPGVNPKRLRAQKDEFIQGVASR